MKNIKGFANRHHSHSRALRASITSVNDIRRATQPRSLLASKRQNGVVLVIAGSSRYHGAPTLASTAAQNMIASLRIGTGYAIAYVPMAILDIVRDQSPAIIVNALGSDHITFNQVIKKAIGTADAVVIGMGIGRESYTLREAAKILDYCFMLNKKVVIDADAIYAIRYTKVRMSTDVVVTPHDREFWALSGKMPNQKSEKERINAAVVLAGKLEANVILKGHDSIITDGKRAKVNRSKGSALATMGTGDVLSGIIAGYAATGADMFEASVAGVYLHSMIGDALAKKMGNHIISADVVESIPSALKKFDKNKR